MKNDGTDRYKRHLQGILIIKPKYNRDFEHQERRSAQKGWKAQLNRKKKRERCKKPN
jgi:hypothetical protein